MSEVFDTLHLIFLVGGFFFLLGAFWGRSFLHHVRKALGYVWGPKYLKYRKRIIFKKMD